MADQSYLDNKYFIDQHVYNCPFCKRRNVKYELVLYGYRGGRIKFNWSANKECFVYFAKCSSCNNVSMHLSFEDLGEFQREGGYEKLFFNSVVDIDSKLFYSAPTSFFVMDNRIPAILRELIMEAEGCVRMNYLTGASVCTRKAIYEFLALEKAEGENYEDKIHSLKERYGDVATVLFDSLAHIQQVTSDKVHEQSWPKWSSGHVMLLLESLKTILVEVYVHPDERMKRSTHLQQLREKVFNHRSGQK